MEHVLVETLVNVRQYQCMLHFELPLDVPVASPPEIRARVQGIRPWLKPEGLFLQGTILEELSCQWEHGKREQAERLLHFTYLIPAADLQEPNLLNFQVETALEPIHYHCIRKDRQVIVQQNLLLRLTLYEYHVQESPSLRDTGLQKKSGVFLKHAGEVEESTVKIYSVPLPDDFSLLIKSSGRVNELKAELTDDGCILDWVCHFQGEYVTDEGKVGTFFFEKNEYVFFPVQSVLTTRADQVRAFVTIPDLTFENPAEWMVLYRCRLQLVETCEQSFYTGDPAALPDGVAVKRVEVEQIGREVIASQMLEDVVDLAGLAVDTITQITGECKQVDVEEVQGQLLVSGVLEITVTYLDVKGWERTCRWERRLDQIIPCTEPGSGWQMKARVQIPDWAFADERLSLAVMVDYQGCYRVRSREWILTRVPEEWLRVQREKLLVREEIDIGHITLSGEENVFLHRYATRIMQISGQVPHWEIRPVDGGWVAKGQAELVIYYETGEGERHIEHRFHWYQFIPWVGSAAEIILRPEMRVLDHEMREDGSLMRLRYLIRLCYTVQQEREEELVTEMEPAVGRMRPVITTGRMEKQFAESIELEDGSWTVSRIREIRDVEIGWRDYAVNLREKVLALEGEVEVTILSLNRFGKERVQVFLLPLRWEQPIATEGDTGQQVRAVPVLKGYDYRLTGHPPKESRLELFITVELSYRLVGQINCF